MQTDPSVAAGDHAPGIVGWEFRLIVQDTGMCRPLRNQPGGWAFDAVEQFLQENDAFAPDRSRERLWLTSCPGSWLKRVC